MALVDMHLRRKEICDRGLFQVQQFKILRSQSADHYVA